MCGCFLHSVAVHVPRVTSAPIITHRPIPAPPPRPLARAAASSKAAALRDLEEKLSREREELLDAQEAEAERLAQVLCLGVALCVWVGGWSVKLWSVEGLCVGEVPPKVLQCFLVHRGPSTSRYFLPLLSPPPPVHRDHPPLFAPFTLYGFLVVFEKPN